MSDVECLPRSWRKSNHLSCSIERDELRCLECVLRCWIHFTVNCDINFVKVSELVERRIPLVKVNSLQLADNLSVQPCVVLGAVAANFQSSKTTVVVTAQRWSARRRCCVGRLSAASKSSITAGSTAVADRRAVHLGPTSGTGAASPTTVFTRLAVKGEAWAIAVGAPRWSLCNRRL